MKCPDCGSTEPLVLLWDWVVLAGPGNPQFLHGESDELVCPICLQRTLSLPDQIAEWNLEPELECPIPREVVLKKGYIPLPSVVYLLPGIIFAAIFAASWELGWLVFAGCLWFLALGILFSAERDRRLSKLLVTRGLATRGVVVAGTTPVMMNTEATGPDDIDVEWIVAYGSGLRLALEYPMMGIHLTQVF